MSTDYGKFGDFCRDSTLPICNLFSQSPTQGGNGFGGCQLNGIHLSGRNRQLTNLGSIIIAGLAIFITLFLLWRSERKKAAVGRREMQLFLLGYIIIEICEIFTVGGFPLKSEIRIAFTAIHIAAITATTWILMLNAAVGYQAIDDGTFLSVGLILGSALLIAIGTGYIALDCGFRWTGYFSTREVLNYPNRIYSLYTLYLLVPIVFMFIFFILESWLVLRVLGEKMPMLYLISAVLLFAIGQIFNFVISVHLCNASGGAINGALFETLFTLLAVIMIWVFWSSITEDDWPIPVAGSEVGYT